MLQLIHKVVLMHIPHLYFPSAWLCAQAEEVPELQQGQLLGLVYRLLSAEHEKVMQVRVVCVCVCVRQFVPA